MEDIKQSFIQVYEKNADALFRYALYNLNNRELSKDMVAETFARIWNYLVNGGKIDNMRAFLYRTLKNLIVDYFRSKKTLSLDRIMEEETFVEPVSDIISPEEYSDGKVVMRILDQISPDYKEIIIMRYVQGLSFKEIAKINDENENTVAVRFHRAIKRLKEIFQTKDAKN